jgi:hypothetical protein
MAAVEPEVQDEEAPSDESAETAVPDLPQELVDESIEADAQSPDEPGPGDSEGESPAAPPEAEQE